jgi:hypothetical protein
MHNKNSTEHDETFAVTAASVLKGEKDRLIFIPLTLYDAVATAETISLPFETIR